MVGARVVGAVAETAGHAGQCLCGAVAYRAQGLRDMWFCHCSQCRKVTGHYLAACRTEHERFDLSGEIAWSAHSGTSQLGRCARCASPLFWRQPGSPTMSVLAGSLEHTHGIGAVGHAFVGEKGDYYAIPDGLPQFTGTPTGGF